MRADPDVWLAAPEVQQAQRILGSSDDCYTTLIKVGTSRLRTVAGSEGAFVMRHGDLRILVDSSGVNQSKSHNVGFNVGAVPFRWNNKVFLAGGSGFWDYHAKVVEFVPNTGEWEWLPCPEGPEHINESCAWWDARNNRVVALGFGKTATGAIENTGRLYALNMEGYFWEVLGGYNPVFELLMMDKGVISLDLGDYFVLASMHNSLIVRKWDLQAVVTGAFNRNSLGSQIKAPVEEGLKCFCHAAGELRVEHHRSDDSVVSLLRWDVDSAFKASEAECSPFVLPLISEDEGEGADADPEERPWQTLAVVLSVIAAFVLGRRRGRDQGDNAEIVTTPKPAGSAHVNEAVGLSPVVLKFHSLGPIQMDTEEVNALLDLGDDLTGETKRARRAQAIRQVNQEYVLRYGANLIRRERHKADRRRTTYVIQPYSGNA
ncbi:MAG: hypothetical protein L7S63_02020 [Flavobacteriales bacterium]|nr:hypothetical protein [Flavobacteriales bacterium]